MNESDPLARRILETTRAFTQALEMENAVHAAQLRTIQDSAVSLMESVIRLSGSVTKAGRVQPAEEHKEPVQTAQAQTTRAPNQPPVAATVLPSIAESPIPATPAAGEGTETRTWEDLVLAAVLDSYRNAIYQQQQTNVTDIASLTQGLTLLFSILPETLAVQDTIDFQRERGVSAG